MKRYFTLFVSLAMVMSCAKNLPENFNKSSEQISQTVTVKVVPFVGMDTKSTISTTGDFTWTSGDKFGVYPLKNTIGAKQTSQQVMFQVQESSINTDNGIFTGTGWGLVTGGTYKYFAYYPYDIKAKYDTVIVSYPSYYSIAENSSTAHIRCDYLVAPVVIPETSTDASFTFYHIGSLVKFKINLPEGDREATFNYFEVSCAEDVFATEGYYSPTGLEISGEPAKVTYPTFTATSYSNKIMCELNNFGPDSEGNINVNLMLPPSALNNKDLKVTVLGNNAKGYSATKKMGGDLVSGNVYTTSFTVTEDPNVGNNISKTGTANCYIVNKANTLYRFNCKVRGNGVDPIPGDTETADISGYESAQVIWECVNSDTAPAPGAIIKSVKLDKTNGFVCFVTPSTFVEGNALISIKDKDENIIWSWHIWATQADIEGNAQTYNPNNAGAMMDRNLGALSAEPGNPLTNGLYYQGGRPWPFRGASDFTNKKAVTTNNDIWENVTTSTTVGTLEYSAKHPTHFICKSSENIIVVSSTNYDGHWLWQTDPLLWDVAKTMYDPCPIGWKIPSASTYPEVINPWVNVISNDSFPFTNNGRTLNSPAAYYPANGNISPSTGDIESCGTYGYFWTVRERGGQRYSSMFFHKTGVNTDNPTSKAYGIAIRPIKD